MRLWAIALRKALTRIHSRASISRTHIKQNPEGFTGGKAGRTNAPSWNLPVYRVIRLISLKFEVMRTLRQCSLESPQVFPGNSRLAFLAHNRLDQARHTYAPTATVRRGTVGIINDNNMAFRQPYDVVFVSHFTLFTIGAARWSIKTLEHFSE